MITRLLTGLAMMAALLATPARAEDGRQGGTPASASAAAALPRFATSTELFELVGVVNGKQLTLYLDRFEDNAPVKGAKVDLEIGGAKIALKEQTDGEFQGSLPKELASGITPVTATVAVGNETDLLAADLDVRSNVAAPLAQGRGWKVYLGWVLGGLLLIAVLAWVRKRSASARQAGGAA